MMGENQGEDYVKMYFKPDSDEAPNADECILLGVW
jgi:hypothetical protein